MHTPSKVKTKADLIKKSIMDQQLFEGTYIIDAYQKPKGLSEIVI